MAEHKTISFEEAKHIIDTEKDCVVLDVREESEYLTGHIEDALNFPVDTISEHEASEMISDKIPPCLFTVRQASEAVWHITD